MAKGQTFWPNRRAVTRPIEMITLTTESKTTGNDTKWLKIQRALGLALVAAISAAIIIWGDEVENLPIYGYPAVFLLSLIGNASLILPAPSYVIVFAAGSALDPLLVGIVAGLGASLGELTGYLAGVSGKSVVENRPLFSRVRNAMEKSGVLVIFLLGVIPNPFFDIGGILAGVTRLAVWKFLLAAWAGKSIRLWIVAFSGSRLL